MKSFKFKLVLFSIMFIGMFWCVSAESPIGVGYMAFVPHDNWNDHQGWYVIGLHDNTSYNILKYNPNQDSWDEVLSEWNTINNGELHTHMSGLSYRNTYQVVSTKPIQAIVTSGEGSNMIPAATSGRYIGKNFIYLGDYDSDLYGKYATIVFGLRDNTRVNISLYTDSNGNKNFDAADSKYKDWTGTLKQGEYFTASTTKHGTTFWNVQSDKDVLVVRTSVDGDELDYAVSSEGRRYGKTLYFANMGPRTSFKLGFRIRNMENNESNVIIYDLKDPSNPIKKSEFIVPPKGLYSVKDLDFSYDTNGIRYAKIVSDKDISVVAGYNYMRGDTIFSIPSINGDGKSYVTNMIYGGSMNGEDHGNAAFNEFVGVDVQGSRINITPQIEVSGKTLQYYSAGSSNKVYYTVNGNINNVTNVTLNAGGIHTYTFPNNARLTGFYVDAGSDLAWGNLGNLGSSTSAKRWNFSSENSFLFRQGGNGNCWILGINSPNPWFEVDQVVGQSCAQSHITLKIKSFSAMDTYNVVVKDELPEGITYKTGSATLNGISITPTSTNPLIFNIGNLSAGSPLEPNIALLEFAVSATHQIKSNNVSVNYDFWDQYWGMKTGIVTDNEVLTQPYKDMSIKVDAPKEACSSEVPITLTINNNGMSSGEIPYDIVVIDNNTNTEVWNTSGTVDIKECSSDSITVTWKTSESKVGKEYHIIGSIELNDDIPENNVHKLIQKCTLPLKASIISPTKTSFNQGSAITFDSEVSGGVAPYTYSWKDGETIISTKKTFTTTDLKTGTNVITLTVTDGSGSSAIDSISIEIKKVYPYAEMAIYPSKIEEYINEGDSKTVQLEVYNFASDWLYGVYFSYEGVMPSSWISFDKQHFKVGPQGMEYANPTITVPFDVYKGTYKGTLIAHSNNSGIININLIVHVNPSPARLYVPINNIVERDITSDVIKNIPVTNIGTTTLENVQLTASPSIRDYLEFSNNKFKVNAGATVQVITTLHPPSEKGVYKGTINIISDNGGSHTIDVTISPPECGLKVSPDAIELKMMKGEASTAIIDLENLDLSPLSNINLENAGLIKEWITLSKNNTALSPKGRQTISAIIEVPYDTNEGVYNGNINVLSECGGRSIPVEVTVSYCNPDIDITTGGITEQIAAGGSSSEFIELSNTGCQLLHEVKIEASGLIGDWIKFDNQGFSIGPSGTKSVKANIRVPRDTWSGTYTGKITVTGTTLIGYDVAETTDVLIKVTEPTNLNITPFGDITITTFPAVTAPKTLCIENIGDEVLSGVNLEVQGTLSDWVKFDKNDFSVKSKEQKCVVMEVTPSDNAVLTEYKDTLLITADNDLHLTLDLIVKVIPLPPTTFIASPSNLNIFVESGESKTDTIKLTDLTSDFKQVYFNVIGDIYYLIKLDKADVLFSGTDRTKELTYTVTIPDTFKGVSEGAIMLSGDINMEIPVTISTIPTESVVLSISDITANSGDQIEVPINIENAKKVGAVDLIVIYDPKVLTAKTVKTGSLTSNAIIASNIKNGIVSISIASAFGFSGTGSIATLNFEVIGNNGDISHLILSNVELSDATTYDKIQVTTKDGSVTVGQTTCGITGDINGDSKVTSLDALMALQMSVGLIPVDICADVNRDGKVTSLDALMILQASVGLIEF